MSFGWRHILRLIVLSHLFCGGTLLPQRLVWGSEGGANELIVRALEMRRRGNEQGALPLFQEAYKKSPSARAAGQLGFCHQALGQWAEAENYLTSALDKAADPWVVKNRSVIEGALATVRSHVGRIEVVGDPPGAEVAVNGSVVGKFPLGGPVRVANGEVEVEVRASGYVSKTKSFHIDGGQYQRTVLRLEREPPPAPPAPTATALAATAAAVPESPPAAVVSNGAGAAASDVEGPSKGNSSPDSHTGRLALKWIAWGAGLAGVGTGVYGVVANQKRVETFDQACGLDALGNARSDVLGVSTAECASRKSAYESARVVAIVGFVGAAALTALGFLLWATEPETSSSPHGISLSSCGFQLGPRLEPGAACAFHF